MVQKTTYLAGLAVLLAIAAAAVASRPAPLRTAPAADDSEPVARGAIDAPRERRAPAGVPSAVPAAPRGSAAMSRSTLPPVQVAADEAVRDLVFGGIRIAARGPVRGDEWTPGDVVLRVLADRADAAIACRHPTDSERRRGLHGEQLGDLILAIVAHPSNPVGDVAASAVRDLVRGAVSDWRELGGPTGPIHLVLPPPGARADLYARILARGDTLSRAATFAIDDEERLRSVAADPAAVTVVSLEAAQRLAMPSLRVDGVPAGHGTVRIGRYPFATPIVVVHDRDPAALRLVTGLASEAARAALAAHLTIGSR